MKDSEELTKSFVDYTKEYLLKTMSSIKLVNLNVLKYNLTEELGRYIYSKTDRKPIIIPVFMDLAQKA